MTFDALAYWRSHSPPVYPEHRAQEAVLVDVLSGLDYASVLEVGCGDGRITALLSQPVTVLDILPERVAATAERTGSTGICASLQDFTTDQRWDLVIAVEVLMHIPPTDIEQACDKLLTLSGRWVVTCDWTAPLPGPPSSHNWLHDYQALLHPLRSVSVGRQTIHVAEAAMTRIPIDSIGYSVNPITGTIHTRYADHGEGIRTRTEKGVHSLLNGKAGKACQLCYGKTPPYLAPPRPPQRRRISTASSSAASRPQKNGDGPDAA